MLSQRLGRSLHPASARRKDHLPRLARANCGDEFQDGARDVGPNVRFHSSIRAWILSSAPGFIERDLIVPNMSPSSSCYMLYVPTDLRPMMAAFYAREYASGLLRRPKAIRNQTRRVMPSDWPSRPQSRRLDPVPGLVKENPSCDIVVPVSCAGQRIRCRRAQSTRERSQGGERPAFDIDGVLLPTAGIRPLQWHRRPPASSFHYLILFWRPQLITWPPPPPAIPVQLGPLGGARHQLPEPCDGPRGRTTSTAAGYFDSAAEVEAALAGGAAIDTGIVRRVRVHREPDPGRP